MRWLHILGIVFLWLPSVWAADTPPRTKLLPSLGWSLDQIVDPTSLGTTTGTTAAFTNLVSCTVAADANGNLYCSSAAGSGTVTSITQGTNMSFSVTPITTSGTINLVASPSITNLTATGTVTGLVISGTSALQVGSDYITDITGSGLSISGGILSVSNHNMLSATHSDSSAASATRGDLIVANTTPNWARFAVGGSNTVLTANGTDPSWSASPTLTSLTATNTVTGATIVATSVLQSPSAGNPSINQAGSLAQDTTDTQFIVGGAAPYIYPATYRECHTFENVVAADDNVLFMVARNDLTVTASHCRTSGFTTQPTIALEDDSGNAMTGAPTCNATTTQASTAVSAGGAVTQNEAVRFDTTNTPAPTFGTETTICIDYTWSRK